MGTRVYGASDDLIEIEGDLSEEIDCYGTDSDKTGVLLVFSDSTMVDVQYGKNDSSIWGIKVLRKGSLFDRIEECDNEDADPYSDQLFLNDGVEWVVNAREWNRTRKKKT